MVNADLKFPRIPSVATPIDEYIDRVCNEFEAGWVAGQPARIEDLLPRVEPGDRARLFGELLALEVAYRWRVGERPDPGDYRRRFPEFVAEVDAGTSMVGDRPPDQATGGDASGRTDVDAAAQTSPWAQTRSGTNDATGEAGTRGRYSLTTVHMDGGVSRVWLARDGDLGREIALKELLPESASHPQLWSRFLAEARITGQLQHPGVVPVYELARRPDNHQPFYTMPFFRWPALAEVIRDYRSGRADVSSSPDTLAGLLEAFIAICNAVGYAHSRGVVHRDLKPQNVVVGEFGQVMVLDWGLARLVEVAEAASPEPPVTTVPRPASDQTVAGQVLGTPAYMAPEQAEGRIDRIDRRTDIYGLGAILYEILTGRPPFAGRNTDEILAQVRSRPPTRPRCVFPQVPAALEAICLRAMARDPDDRYDSAVGLGRDVRFWLIGEPVSVYRDPWPTRLARWARRHKTAVVGLLAVLMTVLAALAVSTVLIGRKQAETDEARRLAEANFAKARDAVEQMLMRVGRERLDRTPQGIEQVRRELLEDALRFQLDFLRQRPGDPVLRHDLARARIRAADLWFWLGRRDEAEPAYVRGISELERLAVQDPDNLDHRAELASGCHNLGHLLTSNGRAGEGERYYRRAIDLQRRLLSGGQGTPPDRLKLVTYLSSLALSLRGLGQADQTAEAEALLREAQGLGEALVAEDPRADEPRAQLVAVLGNLGMLLRNGGRYEDSVQSYRRAIEFQSALTAADDAKPRNVQSLAKLHDSLGQTLAESGRTAEAEREYREGVIPLEVLTGDFPSTPAYRGDLAGMLNNLANLVKQDKTRRKEAETLLRRATRQLSVLVEKWPRDDEYRLALATTFNSLGTLLSGSGRAGEAERPLRDGLAALGPAPEVARAGPRIRSTRGMLLHNLADLLQSQGKHGEAVALLREAVEHQRAALEANPHIVFYRQSLSDHYWLLSGILLEMGRYREAAAVADLMPSLFPDRPQESYYAAGFLCRCIPLVLADREATEAERRSLARGYGDRALIDLEHAVAHGFRDEANLRQARSFDPLRDREGFRELLRKMGHAGPVAP